MHMAGPKEGGESGVAHVAQGVSLDFATPRVIAEDS